MKRPRQRTMALAAALAVLGLATAGCNTVEGVGKDLKAGGQAIEKAAQSSKTK
jgi:predicted small secreted protein